MIAVAAFALRKRVYSPAVRATIVLVACTGPLAALNRLPPFQFNTLIKTALAHLLVIYLVSVVAMPGFEAACARDFFGGLAWPVLPLRERGPAERQKSRRSRLRESGLHLGYAAFKLLCGIYLRESLLAFLEEGAQLEAVKGSLALTTLGAALYFVLILCTTLSNDILQAVVPLITEGRYGVLTFEKACLASTSLGEFWGRRYNLVVSTLLRERIYQPLRSLAGWSKGSANMASFAASALLHAHLAHTTFRAAPLQTAAMFLLQGVGIAAERRLGIRRLGAVLGWAWTASYIAATGPLFFGLFVHAGAEFLKALPPFAALDFVHPWLITHIPLFPLPLVK